MAHFIIILRFPATCYKKSPEIKSYLNQNSCRFCSHFITRRYIEIVYSLQAKIFVYTYNFVILHSCNINYASHTTTRHYNFSIVAANGY